MKTYQEYDSEIQGCDNLIKMLEKTIEEIKTKQWKLKEARRKAYEVVHPRCSSEKEFEYHTSHSWFETHKCCLDKGHVGRHKSGV